LAGLPVPRTGIFFLLGSSLVPSFFVLSGFLVAGSALRLRLRDYLVNRGLRIFPALSVEVLLSAFLLGPIVTALGIGAYLGEPGTYRYLGNMIGLIVFELPGVFQTNPVSTVNMSLWTVPHELLCYAMMAALVVVGVLKRPRLVLALAVGWLLFSAFMVFAGVYAGGESGIAGRIAFRPGVGLMQAFLVGVAAFLFRYRLRYDGRAALIALGALLVIPLLDLMGAPTQMRWGYVFLVKIPALAYLTLYVGISKVKPLPLFRRGDYSYGIYLYGAPIQQLVIWLLPSASPLVTLPLALLLITAFAMVSWHVVEKPVLALRRRFSFVARARGVAGPGQSSVDAPPPARDRTGEVLSYGAAAERAAI
jgi:peptidoglycan/LPS O-acetylase OafA/YrhL